MENVEATSYVVWVLLLSFHHYKHYQNVLIKMDGIKGNQGFSEALT